MFYKCTSLTEAPELPATTMKKDCYYGMFCYCTALTTAPVLPATTLAKDCYEFMFYGCKALTQAPALPATTLAEGCYYSMFSGCTSLTEAPALPATTLEPYCYYEMFKGCSALTKAPELPATTLVADCYKYMFYDCSSLNAVTCLATYISADDCTYNWLSGVAASGTLTVPNGMEDNWTKNSSSGCPEGWNVRIFGTGTADVSGTDAGRSSCGWVQLWENGPKFAEFNVGATITDYTSATDYTTANIGGYYGWGGTTDKDNSAYYNGTEY